MGEVAVIDDVVLAIPDRPQAPESPPSGWCGETAIQEALLHLGTWAPQRFIHAAGKSKHPDLYSQEIPTALANLGVITQTYSPKTKSGWAEYRAWVEKAIDDGDPVFAGVKLLPSEHPTWGLDHFVLVVGYGKKGFLVNTTWNERRWADEKSEKGISFRNAFFAIRLHDIAAPPKSRHARAVVVQENASTVKLRVSCPAGTERIEQRSSLAQKTPDATWLGARVDVSIDAGKPARFHCF